MEKSTNTKITPPNTEKLESKIFIYLGKFKIGKVPLGLEDAKKTRLKIYSNK
jgi:hypothetical protein